MAAEVVGTAFVRIRALTTNLAKDIERGVAKGAKDADVDASGASVGDRFAKTAGESINKGIGDAVTDSTKDLDKKVDLSGSERAGTSVGDTFTQAFQRALSRGRFAEANDLLSKRVADDFKAGFEVNLEKAFESGDFEGAQRLMRKRMAFDKAGDDSALTFVTRFRRGIAGVFSRDGNKAGSDFGSGLGKGLLLKLGVLFSPAILGAASLLIQYVVALTAQIGLLVQAAAGAGAVLGGAFGVAALAIAPLFAAFKTETPALDRFKKRASEVGDAWKEFGAATQETLLPGLTRALGLTRKLIPIFRGYGRAIGEIVGRQSEYLASLLTSEEGQRRFRSILQQSTPIFDQMLTIAIRLGDILSNLFEAVLPATGRFIERLDEVVSRWQLLIAVGNNNGTLAATFELWRQRADLVVGALGDLFGAIWNILQVGGDAAVPFFENFAQWAEDFRNFTESTAGQNKLRQIFDDALEVAHEFNGLIADIGRRIGGAVFEEGGNEGIIGFIRVLREDVVPFLDTTFRQLIENLGPSLQAFGEAFGDFFTAFSDAGGLALAITLMAAFLDVLTAIISIPGMDRFLGFILGLAGAFAVLKTIGVVALVQGLAGAIGTLAASMTAGGAATGIFGAGIAVGLASLAAAAAIVAGVIAAVALLVIHWDTLKEAFNAVTRFLKDPMKRLERLGELLGDLVGWVKDLAGDALGALGDVLSDLGEDLAGIGEVVLEALGDAVGAVRRFPGQVVRVLGRLGSTIIKAILDQLRELPGRLGEALQTAFEIGFELLRSALHRMIQAALISVVGIPLLIIKILTVLGPKLIEVFQDAFEALARTLPGLIEGAIEFFVNLPETILDALSSLGEDIAGFFTDVVFPGVTGAVSTGVESVLNFFRDLPGNALDFLSGLGSDIEDLFEDAIELGRKAVETGINAIIGFFRDLPGNITAFVTDVGEAALGLGETIISKIISGLAGTAKQIGGAASALLDGIGDLIGNLKAGLFGAIDRLIPNEIGKVEVDIPGLGKTTLLPGIPLPDNPLKSAGLYAMGGIFDQATAGILGEAGREVLIPLTRPARARQLADESGLSDLLAQGSERGTGIDASGWVFPTTEPRESARQMISRFRSLSFLLGGG